MSSTYSNLKIQLMTTGENNSTWGDVTNVNLGTAIEEAITGSADVAFSGANVTLTLTDTNTAQTARNLRLNLTGTGNTAGYNLIVPAIEKAYIVNNGTDGTITIKNATGTGIAVPSGKSMWVFNTGVNVVEASTYITALSTGALSAASANIAGNILLSAASPTITFNTGGAYLDNAGAANTLAVSTSATERFRIGASGQWGLSGANYGTSGQVLTSQGASAAPVWTTVGTVTSVGGTGSVNGLTLTGTVTSSGNLTLGGSITSVAATATINGVVIGYRSIPRSTTTTTATTADVGKCIAVSANIAIPNSTFAAGDAVSIYNDSAAAVTITSGVTTLRLAGTTTTGNRTLAARGMATVWFNSATEAVISGSGLS